MCTTPGAALRRKALRLGVVFLLCAGARYADFKFTNMAEVREQFNLQDNARGAFTGYDGNDLRLGAGLALSALSLVGLAVLAGWDLGRRRS